MLSDIDRGTSNSTVDVIPTMTTSSRGIAKLGWGLSINNDAIQKEIFWSDYAEALSSTNAGTLKRIYNITVTGDANTYYPVAIVPNEHHTADDVKISIYRTLGETCNSSYSGNHGNGTSSLILTLVGRMNGWDGNCNRYSIENFSQPYANLVGNLEYNSSSYIGTVVWLRGGGTLYHIMISSGASLCNVYYSTTNLGNSTYSYNVSPITSPSSISTIFTNGANESNKGYASVYARTITCSGNITASKVYNAVWNDYAELFERGCKSEPGDLISLDTTSSDEKYVLANIKTNNRVVGVYSDEFGHLIGGDSPTNGEDHLVYNLPRYIPVGLCGRVKTKVVGTCKKGDWLVPSEIDGVARVKKDEDDSLLVFGIACEDKKEKEVNRIRVYLK